MNRWLAAWLFVASAALAEDLEPAAFKAALEQQHGLVLDVRTPAEIARGALPQASVIDFNAGGFERKVALIARDRPVFVYCASGGRSARAAEVMRGLGFTRVFNLTGGFKAWSAAGLPVEQRAAAPASGTGVTLEAFDAQLKRGRVLVDFHTPWCTPCQKMAPVIDALEASRPTARVLRIDVDASEALAAREKVQGVPVFVLYVDGRERARLTGEQPLAALQKLLATP